MPFVSRCQVQLRVCMVVLKYAGYNCKDTKAGTLSFW